MFKPEVKPALRLEHSGVNMNETYLDWFLGLRRDVVKDAWSLITGN